MVGRFFLVVAETAARETLQQSLEFRGHAVRTFDSMARLLSAIQRGDEPCVVVSDIRLVDGDGLRLMRALHAHDPNLPVVLVTGSSEVALAVQAMRDGAFDVVEKAPCTTKVLATTCRAYEHRLARTGAPSRETNTEAEVLGTSLAACEIRRLVHALAQTSVDVLVIGEIGTGKEVAARAIHSASASSGPFVAVRCGVLTEAALEIELFGDHAAGAQSQPGKIEAAAGGTLFLDEIELLPASLQTKLFRVLDERTILSPAAGQCLPVQCRFIAATKIDLLEASRKGQFRSDLYFGLELASLRLPALRERTEDIPVFFSHFLSVAAQRNAVEPPGWTAEDVVAWQDRAWPGNARQLRNMAERWCLGLEPTAACSSKAQLSLTEMLARVERKLIEMALRKAQGNVQDAADDLGIPRKTLYDKLSRFEIEFSSFR